MLFVRAIANIGAGLCALLITVSVALSDAIDGQWCIGDGRRIIIAGDNVTTPGGWTIKGDYGRHHYMFRMPSHERNAGKQVDMVLVNENRVHLRYQSASNDGTDTVPEVWMRCSGPLSLRPATRFFVRLKGNGPQHAAIS